MIRAIAIATIFLAGCSTITATSAKSQDSKNCGVNNTSATQPNSTVPSEAGQFLSEDDENSLKRAKDYVSFGDIEAAIQILEALKSSHPDEPRVYSLLGNCYFAANDFEKAKLNWQRCMDLTTDTTKKQQIRKLLDRIPAK